MHGRVARHLARHEWKALTRRNVSGLITGLMPLIAAPLLGFVAVSIVESMLELTALGVPSSPELVLPIAVACLNIFPLLYTVFLASDSVVLEKELGTIELLLWAPIRERDLLIGKAVLPALYNLTVGSLNILIFSGAYAIASSLLLGRIMIPWIPLAMSYLLFVVTVILGVMVGILVSTVASNSKAAATIALSMGSFLVLVQAATGLLLYYAGLGLTGLLLGLSGFTFLLTLLCGLAVLARFGHREGYFLEKSRGERYDSDH